MDEYNAGMDPELKRYFRKILNSFGVGLFWLLLMATAGIFFGLATPVGELRWYNILFYAVFLVTFVWLARYFYRVWAKKN